MARYLERLVTRAGLSLGPLPGAPLPRQRLNIDGADPFESIASSDMHPHAAPVESTAAIKPAEPIGTPSFSPASSHTVIHHTHTTELRIGKDRPPSQHATVPSLSVRETVVPPSRTTRIEHETEVRNTQTLEREVRSELTRSNTRLEPEIERDIEHEIQPAPVHAIEAAQRADDNVEQRILSRLMPTLNAWFASDDTTRKQPEVAENSVSWPRIAPAPKAGESPATLPAPTPGVVIGSIQVDVVPPPAMVSTPSTLPRRRVPTHISQTSSSLRFGLGQM